jgi:hypothetical protein
MSRRSARPAKAKEPVTAMKLKLLSIRLAESVSKLGELKKGQLPGHATQFMSVSLGTSSENTKLVGVNVRIKLDASYDGDQTKDPAMSIMASFVADYSTAEDVPGNDVFQKLISTVGVANIWPYWREFAQSMTTRMGLPAFPVPLINASELAIAGENP